ncbi:hypothetical protein [Piscibacillus salipiscarius]|uniref:hypothetical protein n=1 Tax=Piscibacillus salipiscarius TaxID=299480 RepID=UPI0006D1DF12|nr:hypothetical protein [Piscibacillus salipiscarius]
MVRVFSFIYFHYFNIASLTYTKFFYPSDELSTFITDAEEAQVVSIHPSGKEVELIHVANQLEQLEQQEIKSEQWYRDMTVRKENHEIEERFPYVLTNTSPKSGSGFNGVIYLERDGKGILVTTKDRQYYFRSNESLLKEGADE